MAAAQAESRDALAKVPEVTFAFWIIKVAATTLGETAGDALSMSMHLGYLVSTTIFAAVFRERDRLATYVHMSMCLYRTTLLLSNT